ncbi:MAG: head decoration protein [Deltaproteobacteria bacterium]|nr:head decoration protein [Deltaproteobacteria bacterium]
MPTITTAKTLDAVVRYEQDKEFSREKVVFTGSAAVQVGQVLGRVLFDVNAAEKGTNTGAGTVGTVTAGKKVQIGTYTLACIAKVAGAGTFKVIAPDGTRLNDATVGSAYTSEHLNFTIADGDPDFEVGDSFTVEIEAGSGACKGLDLSATDGTQIAAAIAYGAYNATDGDVTGVAIVREAGVIESGLVWPAGATAGQKADALRELKTQGIVALVEA